ncbi:MAG: type II secretion system F family protein [Candidatus Thalassarchaeaceae archaeon]|jgi:pilus assembly protein TadC|nr:type II secretion system F family protein [Candidatus Thalassarchaeaceae archaeon]
MASEREESSDLLYAMRAIMVMMNSGIGLEAALQMIGRGGYGVISKDFQGILENLQRGARLEDEFGRLSTSVKSKAYKRLLGTLRSNVSSDTDLVRALQQQADREEEERNEKLKGYIETVSGLPTMLLTLGILSPIIFGIPAMLPIIAPDILNSGLAGMGSIAQAAACFGPALFFTTILIGLVGYRAHSKDPGVI